MSFLFKQKNIRGFTLVEIMLYMAITITILVAVVTFFIATLEAHGRQKNITDTDQEMALALHTIESYIAQSTTVDGPSAGSTADTLSLTTDDPDTNPVVITSIDNTLSISLAGGDFRPMTSNHISVYNIIFKSLSSTNDRPSIHVEMTASNPNAFNRQPLGYEQTYYGTVTKR